MSESEILSSLTELSPPMASSEQQPLIVKERLIVEELMEDLEDKAKVMLKYHAFTEITQASDNLKKEKIKLWADRLEVHERTLTRLLKRVENEGFAALTRLTRADAGITKGSKQWKGKSAEEWVEFIKNTYKRGNTASRVMNRSQVFVQVKGHAELELGLKEGEYPSCGFVYRVLESLAQTKKKKRNPGMGPGIIIKVTDNDKNIEEIVVERSNQVWQIDHTRLDNLLVDANGEIISTLWVTAVIDTRASCVMGMHFSFVNPGSHEVALALRHAILQKHYGPEYELGNKKWEACGLPEYIVTDRAKEFKSGHLRRVAAELGIKLRLRLYTEQGGVVERLFLGTKNEFSSKLPGYKGGSLKERPAHPEKYACMCYEEYERWLVHHIVTHRNEHNYPRVTKQTCQTRWLADLLGGKPRMPSSERDLDICLMKETERAIQKYGCIEFECLIYGAGWKKDDQELWRYDADADFLRDYEGKVTVRYDPDNIVYILVYTQEKIGRPSQYLGTIRIKHSVERDLYRDEERLSYQEWQDRKKKRREEAKLVDQSSILAEQRKLTKFSDEKVETHRKRKKTTRERKRDEQHRITRNSHHTNVVQLPPITSSHEAKKSQQTDPSIDPSEFVAEESTFKQPQIEVKPALFVVPNLKDYIENDW